MRNLKLETIVAELEQSGRFSLEKQYYQHGATSVYSHRVQVAFFSLYLSRKLKLRVNERALIRGALLHDYFLYDWHDRDHGHSLHGFTHPGTALKNAKKDYDLDPIEENIIHRHMFPLTPVPPVCWEAWIVCLADKYCALKETFLPLWKRISVVMS